ncbi:MAG: hypothetical protein ACRYFZ_16060 [Janthinobacterium lividum]
MQDAIPNHLNEVERLAGLMFNVFEVGLITGLDPATEGDAFERAMLRGRLREEAELRKSVFELAKAGSAPAQTLAKQFIDQARVAAAGA